jgi:hypothetical protein
MPGRTAKYYADNPEARKKRLEYQKEYNKKDREVKKRVELTKENRKRGTVGNGDGKDLSHTKNGFVLKKASVNRGSKSDMPGDKRARGNGSKK